VPVPTRQAHMVRKWGVLVPEESKAGAPPLDPARAEPLDL